MVHCSQCGVAVTGAFCSTCGTPVSAQTHPYKSLPTSGPNDEKQQQRAPPVAGQPLAAQVVIPTKMESYDCILCKERDLPYKKSMQRLVSEGYDHEVCEECGEELEEGSEYFECNVGVAVQGREGAPRVAYCDRRVCRECINLSRDLKQHSRWHHNDPEWKTSLCDCNGQTRTTICAFATYYHVMYGRGMLQFDSDEALEDSVLGGVAIGFFGLLALPFMIVADVLGAPACFIMRNQLLL